MGDAAQDLDVKGGGLDTAKDLFAGAAGGIAQVLIGMRFLISIIARHDWAHWGDSLRYHKNLRVIMSGMSLIHDSMMEVKVTTIYSSPTHLLLSLRHHKYTSY